MKVIQQMIRSENRHHAKPDKHNGSEKFSNVVTAELLQEKQYDHNTQHDDHDGILGYIIQARQLS